MPKILLLRGPSGSGKSTYARELVDNKNEKWLRISRDNIRADFFNNSTRAETEKHVINIQKSIASLGLAAKYNVIIDDTNLFESSVERWSTFALQEKAEFEKEWIKCNLASCIHRDSLRDTGHVGAAVIYRQFVESGLYKFDSGKKIVIVDVDGTVANCDGVRSPYDEKKIPFDKPYPVVIKWVQELAEEYKIVIVSGRHSSCGDLTIAWLDANFIPFDLVLMRHSWDDRKDTLVKKEILDALIKILPNGKEDISMVLDDRLKVVRMWKEQGLKVYPVRGTGPEMEF